MIVVIAFMPLRTLTADVDISASASSISAHHTESHGSEHENCSMDSVCFTDCQIDSTHCSSASIVIPSYNNGFEASYSYQLLVTPTDNLQSITSKNLFRPPRLNA